MAKDSGKPEGKKAAQGPPGNVVHLPTRCPAEGCGKKPQRAGFCSDHFTWFKEGLISRSGEKAKDFDKKYQAYLRRQKAA